MTEQEYNEYWKFEKAAEKIGFNIVIKQTLRLLNSNTMPTIYILCGIPCSGKSTWANKRYMEIIQKLTGPMPIIISRDAARMILFKLKRYNDYQFSRENEKLITEYCENTLQDHIKAKFDIIIDNTHCKESYIDELLKKFKNTDYRTHVVFFDVPLWKAIYRNLKRSLSGKWIPWKVLFQMRKNYLSINQTKYTNGSNNSGHSRCCPSDNPCRRHRN